MPSSCAVIQTSDPLWGAVRCRLSFSPLDAFGFKSWASLRLDRCRDQDSRVKSLHIVMTAAAAAAASKTIRTLGSVWHSAIPVCVALTCGARLVICSSTVCMSATKHHCKANHSVTIYENASLLMLVLRDMITSQCWNRTRTHHTTNVESQYQQYQQLQKRRTDLDVRRHDMVVHSQKTPTAKQGTGVFVSRNPQNDITKKRTNVKHTFKQKMRNHHSPSLPAVGLTSDRDSWSLSLTLSVPLA